MMKVLKALSVLVFLVQADGAVADPMDGLPQNISSESPKVFLVARCGGVYLAIEEVSLEGNRKGVATQYRLQKEAVDTMLASFSRPSISSEEIESERMSGYIAGRMFLDELVSEQASWDTVEWLQKYDGQWDASLQICRDAIIGITATLQEN